MNKSFCIFLIEAELLNAIKACNGEFLGLLLVMMMFLHVSLTMASESLLMFTFLLV